MDRHNTTVAAIAIRVRDFYDRKEAFRIYHGSTNSTRPANFHHKKMIDTSHLSHVLKIDSEARTALVEPNVSMDALVQATLACGLIPPVVMEFPGITAGGGFAGIGGESSSFKYGFFDNNVNWIEIILATGETVIASDAERADLFRGAAGTFGTLGVVTLLELRLIPAKKYVETTYVPVTSVPDALGRLEKGIEDPSTEFLDGMLFAKDQGVIVSGRLTDTVRKGVKTQRFSRAIDQWHYLHARDIFRKSTLPSTEAVPLVDFLFRWDRGAFWMGTTSFNYFLVPFNRFTRWLLNPLMHTRTMYRALHASGHSHHAIIQDLALPWKGAESFIEFIDKDFGIYPLWLCPLRYNKRPYMVKQLQNISPTLVTKNKMLLNVGVWGSGPADPEIFVEANRAIEQKVKELSGMKWLYAHVYYSEDEFWELYDRKWYDALRLKYHATSLPSMYDKIRVDEEARRKILDSFWMMWPFSGLYGVVITILGSNPFMADESRVFKVRWVLLGVLILVVSAFIAGVI